MEQCIKIKEVWKQFPDLPILYVSNFGNVYIDEYSFTDSLGRVKYFPKRELTKYGDRGEYPYIKISYKGELYRYKVHRLVAMTFIPNPDNKLEVNHIDGDKSNNNVWNLEWVTRLENQMHAQNIGLIRKKKCFKRVCCTCGKKFLGGRNQMFCSHECYKQLRTYDMIAFQKTNEPCEKRKPKHTAEELYWHKDEERCKQKLDLILNSGVDLMKFGYNTKLCRMFPELSKKMILFLLRKYNIPHFERKGTALNP